MLVPTNNAGNARRRDESMLVRPGFQLLAAVVALSPLQASATLPAMTHTAVPVPPGAQMKPGCATKEFGVTVRGVHYFLPTAGSAPSIVTYTPATKAWGSLPITGEGAGIIKSLDGCTMSGVEAPHAGLDDYLVFGGGAGSNRVTQLNLNTKNWTMQKPLSHVTTNLCSSGCLGYAFFATGDFKAAQMETNDNDDDDDAASLSAPASSSFKPSDRQIQRYNLTSGQMEENNMEKTRAGAVCACYSKGASTNYTGPGGNAPRVFFAGGQDDAGATDTVEMWLPAPDIKRRGEPEFSMSFSGRDRGGLVCGGRLVLAGGLGGVGQLEAETRANARHVGFSRRRRSHPKPKPAGKKLSNLVDVWMANTTGPVSATRGGGGATGSPGVKPQQVYKLSEAVRLPKVVCLAERYVVIAGGHPAKGCFSSAMHLLDLDAPPPAGAPLPLLPFSLNSTASTFAAVALDDSALFFNGISAEVLRIGGGQR